MAKEQKKDTRSASQRIEDTEQALMSLYQTADNMIRDLKTVKEAIKLLGNKLDSVVKASQNGEPLNDTVLSRIMIENNVDELKSKVTDLITQGVLVAADEVTENSFVVGRELSEDGTVQNPRMQFVVSALSPDVKSKFPGAKVGQNITLQEGKWTFEVLEIYSLATPQAEATLTQESTEASPEASPEAPSETAPA